MVNVWWKWSTGAIFVLIVWIIDMIHCYYAIEFIALVNRTIRWPWSWYNNNWFDVNAINSFDYSPAYMNLVGIWICLDQHNYSCDCSPNHITRWMKWLNKLQKFLFQVEMKFVPSSSQIGPKSKKTAKKLGKCWWNHESSIHQDTNEAVYNTYEYMCERVCVCGTDVRARLYPCACFERCGGGDVRNTTAQFERIQCIRNGLWWIEKLALSIAKIKRLDIFLYWKYGITLICLRNFRTLNLKFGRNWPYCDGMGAYTIFGLFLYLFVSLSFRSTHN